MTDGLPTFVTVNLMPCGPGSHPTLHAWDLEQDPSDEERASIEAQVPEGWRVEWSHWINSAKGGRLYGLAPKAVG